MHAPLADGAADPLADGWVDAAPIVEARDRHRRCTLGECVHYDVVPCEVLIVAAALDAERARHAEDQRIWSAQSAQWSRHVIRANQERDAERARAEAAIAAARAVPEDAPVYYTAEGAYGWAAGRNAVLDTLAAALETETP